MKWSYKTFDDKVLKDLQISALIFYLYRLNR